MERNTGDGWVYRIVGLGKRRLDARQSLDNYVFLPMTSDETVWHSRHEYANLGEDRGEGAAMDATMDEAR